ncbi:MULTISPECIES: Hsp20 family protein [Pseudomonadota]|uniref:Hsp20 family protein n=1 Tax=Pseudomonadota TaxID=1224 RepID=UPI00076A7E84|nr:MULTISPECIES: Hsp20 family protein [Pseudomonadota]
MRTNFDFAPYRRSTVGFDRLFDLLESGARGDPPEAYPAFDLIRESDDSFSITLEVAGFRPQDIEVVAHQKQLVVTGRKAEEQGQGQYLHRGISIRPFERKFQLADFVEVRSASFDNGLLKIVLQRVLPEEMKPRRIEIAAAGGNPSPRSGDSKPN